MSGFYTKLEHRITCNIAEINFPKIIIMTVEKDFQKCTEECPWLHTQQAIFSSSAWLKNERKQFFKLFRVTQQQHAVLSILRAAYPEAVSTARIREGMMDRMSDVSRIVERLEKKTLIDKKRNEQDRRLVDVSINEQGLELLENIDSQIFKLEQLTQRLSKEEAVTLSALLEKMVG